MRKKLFTFLLALAASVGMSWAIPTEFANCYDCWRDPNYPTISGQCNLFYFGNPYVGNYNPSGPWKLEFVEYYNSSSTEYGNIVSSSVANQYGKSPEQMEVYRLYQWQNGAYQPVAYGVLYAYANENNTVEHAAFFEADGHWGCYLTGNTHSDEDDIYVTFDEDASTGFADLHPAPATSVNAARFVYNYDCQRSPAFPKVNNPCTLSGFKDPYEGYKGYNNGNIAVGPWKLEFVAYYTPSNSYGCEYRVTSAVNQYFPTLSTEEKEAKKLEVPIFRLWQYNLTEREYQPATYGIVCAYAGEANAQDHAALFISANNMGCFLSGHQHTTSFNLTCENDLTTGMGDLVAAASASDPELDAIQPIIVAIDAIGTVELSDYCKYLIEGSRAAYDALSDTYKAQITNYSTLTDAEAAWAALVAAAQPYADAVIGLINAIPNPVVYTQECKDAIDAAQAAYDALTDNQKYLVTNTETLLQAPTAFVSAAPYVNIIFTADNSNVKRIENVTLPKAFTSGASSSEIVTIIKELYDIDEEYMMYWYNSSDRNAVEANSTTWTVNPFVGTVTVNGALRDAMYTPKSFNVDITLELPPFAPTPAVDPAVQNVIDLINAIPNPVVYNQECFNALNAVFNAYVALSEEQRDQVTNYDEYLAAEERYYMLASVNDVIEAINEIGDVEFTSACKHRIDYARSEYCSLTLEAKGYVTNYNTLLAAEAAYAALIPVSSTVEWDEAILETIDADEWGEATYTNGSISLKAVDGRAYYVDDEEHFLFDGSNSEKSFVFSCTSANMLCIEIEVSEKHQHNELSCAWQETATGYRWVGEATSVDLASTIFKVTGIRFSLGEAFPEPTPTPAQEGDKLPGAFSVSGEKVVYFSKGNLQYLGNIDRWHFAENQWTIIGNAQASNNRDLFSWGTGDNPDSEDYSTYTEWGNNIEGNWRTLTVEEWTYLFKTRTDASSKYGTSTVAGVEGLILLPDNYDGTAINTGRTAWDNNVISSSEWAAYEAAGAVFLPAAGVSDAYGVYGVGEQGFYWSSTMDALSYDANAVFFGFDAFEGYWFNDVDAQFQPQERHSVRLVSETAPTPASTAVVIGDPNDASEVETFLTTYNGQTIDELIIDRPVLNNMYNTLCLPFDMNATQIAASSLNGVEIREFTGASVEGTTLNLSVGDPVNAVVAGRPYFVKFSAASQLDDLNFEDVEINNADLDDEAITFDGVTFKGTFTPFVMPNGLDFQGGYLFLGQNNQLFWPNTNNPLKPFRAYFYVDVEASTPGNAPKYHGMPARIVEGKNVATGMENVQGDNVQSTKVLENGVLYIIKNDVRYNAQGQVVK